MNQPASQSIEENEFLKKQLNEANKLIDSLSQGINDWMHDYAPEFCDEKLVKESRERLDEFGTLAYMAKLNDQVNKLKSSQAINASKE